MRAFRSWKNPDDPFGAVHGHGRERAGMGTIRAIPPLMVPAPAHRPGTQPRRAEKKGHPAGVATPLWSHSRRYGTGDPVPPRYPRQPERPQAAGVIRRNRPGRASGPREPLPRKGFRGHRSEHRLLLACARQKRRTAGHRDRAQPAGAGPASLQRLDQRTRGKDHRPAGRDRHGGRRRTALQRSQPRLRQPAEGPGGRRLAKRFHYRAPAAGCAGRARDRADRRVED